PAQRRPTARFRAGKAGATTAGRAAAAEPLGRDWRAAWRPRTRWLARLSLRRQRLARPPASGGSRCGNRLRNSQRDGAARRAATPGAARRSWRRDGAGAAALAADERQQRERLAR